MFWDQNGGLRCEYLIGLIHTYNTVQAGNIWVIKKRHNENIKKSTSQDTHRGILKTDIFDWKIQQRVSGPRKSAFGDR